MSAQRMMSAFAVVAMGFGMFAGGCKSVPKDQYDAAIEENRSLRERIASLQDTVNEANSQTDSFGSRQSELEAENRRLQSELEAARSQANSRPQNVSASPSGFENIPGVSGVSSTSQGIAVEVAGDVLFDTASVTLKADAKRSLDRVASVIQSRYPGHPVRIEGYTDSVPIRKSGWKTNERLSAERAMAVEAYLVERGLSNDLVYSAAFGPANPKATNKQSRRVEIVILAK